MHKLLIISDTKMQKIGYEYFGFNSVVKELDVFVKLFDEITWIGFDFSDLPPDKSLLPIFYKNVKVIALPRSGGNGFWGKFSIFRLSLVYIFTIFKFSKNADLIHSRGPSSMMFFALIYSFYFNKVKWWFKYANNWNDSNSAITWKLQKKLMLLNTNSFGTINGSWPNQPSHIISFENPCIDLNSELTFDDSFKNKFKKKSFLFVGRLELKKGFKLIFDSLNNLNVNELEYFHIIGDGPDKEVLLELISKSKFKKSIKFEESCSKEHVFASMRNASFLLLPTTASEGFPKVIAEAWYSGCIPIVSNISSIPHYAINNVNSFVWDIEGDETYKDVILRAVDTSDNDLCKMAKSGFDTCSIFTYDWYKKRIINEII